MVALPHPYHVAGGIGRFVGRLPTGPVPELTVGLMAVGLDGGEGDVFERDAGLLAVWRRRRLRR